MEELEKAYSLKTLVKEMKARGLDIAEEAAVEVYDGLVAWLQKSAALTSTPIDDMIVVALKQLDGEVKKGIDKLDGEVG